MKNIEGEQIIPVRAKCAQCGDIIKIEYHAKDEIWYEAVPRHLNNSRICLNCFVQWADEKFLPWDESISLMPISFHRQRGIQIQVKQGNYTGEMPKWHQPHSVISELVGALKLCIPHMSPYYAATDKPEINSASEEAYYTAQELIYKYELKHHHQ